jgi:hypothetical protein
MGYKKFLVRLALIVEYGKIRQKVDTASSKYEP